MQNRWKILSASRTSPNYRCHLFKFQFILPCEFYLFLSARRWLYWAVCGGWVYADVPGLIINTKQPLHHRVLGEGCFNKNDDINFNFISQRVSLPPWQERENADAWFYVHSLPHIIIPNQNQTHYCVCLIIWRQDSTLFCNLPMLASSRSCWRQFP